MCGVGDSKFDGKIMPCRNVIALRYRDNLKCVDLGNLVFKNRLNILVKAIYGPICKIGAGTEEGTYLLFSSSGTSEQRLIPCLF